MKLKIIHRTGKSEPKSYLETILVKYKITVEEYKELFEKQKGCCAICLQPGVFRLYTGTKGLGIDHCHVTGRVRGLLCRQCNVLLGYARDNPEILQRAAKYLLATLPPQPAPKSNGKFIRKRGHRSNTIPSPHTFLSLTHYE